MNTLTHVRGERGFSLIEVLVALIVVSIGLLGIAKMQAIAYSSTGVASKRSLAAIEAASLASSMHANRAYWSEPATAPLNTTVTGTVVASTDPALGGGGNCTLGGTLPCSPTQLAAYDMQSWAIALQQLLPTDQATIVCQSTASTPVSCTVTIQWTENLVAANKQEAAAANPNAPLQTPTYTLYIQP